MTRILQPANAFTMAISGKLYLNGLCCSENVNWNMFTESKSENWNVKVNLKRFCIFKCKNETKNLCSNRLKIIFLIEHTSSLSLRAKCLAL